HVRWLGREVTVATIVMSVQLVRPLRALEDPIGDVEIEGRFALVWLSVLGATALYFSAENLRAFLRFDLPGAMIQMAAAVVGWEWAAVLYTWLAGSRAIEFV
ncbi:MAG: hypothetical protein AAFZ87_18345, partial [Planctomycetota bacterium]